MKDDPLPKWGLILVGLIVISPLTNTVAHISDFTLLNENNYTEEAITVGVGQSGFISDTLGSFIPSATLASLGDTFNEYHSVRYKGVRMSEILTCLWLDESSYGKYMYGDYYNGKPLAYGHFQIWLHMHPEVSYNCAMSLECSAEYTADEILAGRGWQWANFDSCLER